MKKIKVLMLLSNGFEPDPRVYKEAKTLIKNNYAVSIWCLDRKEKLQENQIYEGIQIKRIRVGKAKSGNIISMAKALIQFRKKVIKDIKTKNEFDIIHCHDFDTAIIGKKIYELKKVPYIFDCHDLYFTQVHRKDKLGTLIQKFLKKGELETAKKASHLITATEGIKGKHSGLKEHFISHGIEKEKITTVWNYPEKSFARKKKKTNSFNIGFIGSIRFLKGFEIVFKSLEKIKNKNIIVNIIGTGVYIKELKEMSKKYSLKINFGEPIEYKKIPSVYAETDLMIVLYDVDNINIKRAIAVKQFESLLFGIPVLVNKDTLNEDFVNKYKIGKAVANVKETKKAIEDIRNNYKKYSKNCLKIAKNHVWETQENKILEIYKKVLNND